MIIGREKINNLAKAYFTLVVSFAQEVNCRCSLWGKMMCRDLSINQIKNISTIIKYPDNLRKKFTFSSCFSIIYTFKSVVVGIKKRGNRWANLLNLITQQC
tara:strand:- start:814 stop:1116 length:303 start_codon:yes stop_codon:yes gene_type:complete